MEMSSPAGDFLIKPALPPVRKIFIPDPGHVIVDADLDGAEARYVAWETGGAFKQDFLNGVKIHVQTMERFFPAQFKIDPKHEPQYTKCKNMGYGTTYVGSARGIASSAAIPEAIVRAFQPWFFGKYPGIPEWHHRSEMELYQKRTASNRFGFRIYYFDRPEGLLPQAVAWQPQSTIGIITQRGQRLLRREFPSIQLLLQVHDSIIFQVPVKEVELLRKVKDRLCSAEELSVPFPNDPLLIPWSFKASRRSWGHAEPINWETLEIAA